MCPSVVTQCIISSFYQYPGHVNLELDSKDVMLIMDTDDKIETSSGITVTNGCHVVGSA